MKSFTRIFFLTILLSGQMFASFADRGAGKRKAAKVVLNIKTPSTFSASLNFNLRNGLKYTGSFLSPLSTTTKTVVPTLFNYNTFVTYQKGNSVYIVPYKQRILVADVRQGFAGAKLIIRMK
jgi:hypothetical protein